MSKRLSLRREDQIQGRVETLRASAAATLAAVSALSREPDALRALSRMKFEALGHDPLDPTRRLNLIEQLNQTFTYLAAFKGAAFLFTRHPQVKTLNLNLGNVSGWDIETPEDEGIAAEVFSAVTPANNQKLREDVKKVLEASQRHRYVLFMSPGHREGPVSHQLAAGQVTVWSLGPAQ
jgi:hypothetical protein